MLPILALAICERSGKYRVGGVVPRSAINKTDLGPRPRVRHKDEYGVTVACIDVSFLVRTPSTFDFFHCSTRAQAHILAKYLLDCIP